MFGAVWSFSTGECRTGADPPRRAQGQCGSCGRPHGRLVCHLGDGRWWDEELQVWRSGRGRPLRRLPAPAELSPALPRYKTQVVLACAHLNHDPTENGPRNLKALCQRCHLVHDRPEHQRRRWLTLRRRKAIGDLFLGLYR